MNRRTRRIAKRQMRRAPATRFFLDPASLINAVTPARLDAAFRWGHALGGDRVLLVADERAPILRSLPRKVETHGGITIAALALSDLPMVFPGYDADFTKALAPAPGHVGVVVVAGDGVGFYDHPIVASFDERESS